LSSGEGRKRFERLRETQAAFWTSASTLLPVIEAGDRDKAMDMLVTQIVPARNAFLDAIAHQRAWQVELAQQVSATAEQRTALTEWLMVAGTIVVILVAGGLAVGMSRHVVGRIGGEPEDVVDAVRAVAQGDLTRPMAVRQGDTTSIMAALADMRGRLTSLVAQVRAGVDNVATASNQIASGNADLSGRTEQQAASLQQTASSMQQMTASVRSNAESARQANQMAAGASEAAQRGGDVVGRVVSTMGEIQSSSQRIADIIGTIDGIAFQTNILALNAAVEAARAGESGRGFAVVAAEVRLLASRSAEAAKQIKSLIHVSVEKVDSGHKLVSEAGRSMDEIVAQVRKVTDLIGEITAASEEQTRGIDQVGTAVQQIDQGTQQNAALVEQSAAAAESLKQQAAQLSQAIAAFRIGSTGPAAARPLQPAIAAIAPASPPMAAAAATTVTPAAPPVNRAAPVATPAATRNTSAIAPAPAAPKPTATAAGPATPDNDWETF
jgi:methyl-accepting chemotaxis protein